MKSKKNRNDFVLILVLLAVILIGFLVVRLQRQKHAFTVDVSVNGTTVATYRLDEEIDTWIDGYQGGQNHLVIQDGCARIEEADCPDKLCVKQGTVSESGESLIRNTGNQYDVLVLAQASMSVLIPCLADITKPILSSMDSGVEAAAKALKGL